MRDNIDVDILEDLLSLGGLGIQYCIKSEAAYANLKEITDELLAVDYTEFNDRYNQRDITARKRMRELVRLHGGKADVFLQGKLFDLVAQKYPDKDTAAFINSYMASKTRKSIDEAKAYVNTMSAPELWDYFCKTEDFTLKDGKAIEGFMPDWIGEFYAYYQWYYNLPSSEVVKKVPVAFLEKAYGGLHDLELDLAVQKVGEV